MTGFKPTLRHFGKHYDLIIRLFNIIVYYMNELALRALWFLFCVPIAGGLEYNVFSEEPAVTTCVVLEGPYL